MASTSFISPTTPVPDRVGLREVTRIAWPIMASMLSFTAMNFVNVLWVGPLGMSHLAAAGLGSVLMYAVHGFGIGALTGLKITVAQAHGEGDDETARRLLWQGLHLAFWMGLLELFFIPLAHPVIALLGGSDTVTPLAADYFTWRVIGAVPHFVMTALTQYLQGRGQTLPPMWAMILANLCNVGLDPLLIYGLGPIPPLGIAGAGLAATLSFTVGALFLVWVARPVLARTPARVARPLLARIGRIGLPLGGRATLEVGSYLVFQAILTSFGDAHLAAHVLVVRTIAVSFLPGYAISEAVSVLVGQAVGAQKLELVPQIQRAGLKIAVSFMCAWALVFVLFPEPLARLHGATPEVVGVAIDLFIVSAFFQIFDAFAMTGLGVLNGVGDTRFVLLATVTIAWLGKLPLGYLLAQEAHLGAVGAWWGIVFEVIILWAVVAWRVRAWRVRARR
jgi:MATE family multidrug resistance protein